MRTSDNYVSFFLNCPAAIAKIECLEISHPSFSQVYRVVRNVTQGIRVRHEDSEWHDYIYYPLRIKMQTMSADLDFGVNVDLGDLGTLVPMEMQRVRDAGTIKTKASVVYRIYRSDVLDTIMEGPYRLEAKIISYTREGASFEATAAAMNINMTGIPYDLLTFYPLRGFLY